MATQTDLPDAWRNACRPAPTAVRTFIEKCNVSYRLVPYLYGENGIPRMQVEDLKEDYEAWSSGERLAVEFAIHLFKPKKQEAVSLSRMARVFDDQNWAAFWAALERYGGRP